MNNKDLVVSYLSDNDNGTKSFLISERGDTERDRKAGLGGNTRVGHRIPFTTR